MPGKKFVYRVNNVVRFEQQLETMQCAGIKSNGEQCGATVTIGLPYCPTHMKSVLKLTIKDSTVPNAGKGLFACDPTAGPNEIIFSNDDLICDYGGEPISVQQMNTRYGDHVGPYCVRNGNSGQGTHVEDGAARRGVGTIANHSNNANAGYFYSRYNRRFKIWALADIRNGEEIFCNYGPGYQINEPGVSFKDVRIR